MKLNILSKPAAQQPEEILRYDYSVIADEDERNAVMGAALTIKPMMRRAAEDLVKIGQELIAVKDMLPHGEFTPWLETEFNLNARTARRMMAVAERIGHKLDTLSDLSASVLYELAAEATPDEAIRRVGMLAASGEKLTVQDVRSVVASVPANGNAKAVYWQPEATQPNGTAPAVEAAPAQPEAPTQADRTLTVEQTAEMIERARKNRADCPELAVYRGAGWAIYLANTYGFWPTIDVTKKAIAQIMRTSAVEAAYERRMLDYTETQATIGKVLDHKFDNDVDRLAFLDTAGPDAYVEVLRPDRYIHSATFEQARAAIRKEVAPRAAKEAAKRQEDERQKAVQSDKRAMLAALSRSLAELPEGAEDSYYDLTGSTYYSDARMSIMRAIKELENTMEAKKVE